MNSIVATISKPPLRMRPLVDGSHAAALEGLFKILANAPRLTMLHALVLNTELCASELAAAAGLSLSAASNHLQRLEDRRIVAATRRGSNVYYRIVDPCVMALLDRGLCLLEDTQDSR